MYRPHSPHSSDSDEERDERDSAVIEAAVVAARATAAAAHPAARAARGARHSWIGLRDDAREVPIGFARWESPAVDPASFAWWAVGGWRVAVPRPPGPDPRGAALRARAEAVARRLAGGGPAAAGYVRVGDSLVPATLSPGERATLAYAAARPDSPPAAY